MYDTYKKIGGCAVIGYQTENNANRFLFDISEYQKKWPDGTPHMIVCQNGKTEPYIAKTELDGGKLIWMIERYDVSVSGDGSMWVVFLNESQDLVGYTPKTTIRVLQGPPGIDCEEAPTITMPWLHDVFNALKRLENAANRAENAAKQAERIKQELIENPVSGLPEGGKPLQSIVMDENGKPIWENAPWRRMMKDTGDIAIMIFQTDGKSVIDVMKTLEFGLYTVYIQRGCPGNPAESEAIESDLRGMMCVTTNYGEWCYGWIIAFDEQSNFYIQYVRGGTGGGWTNLNVSIDTKFIMSGAAADSKAVGDALGKKLDADKLQEATDAALEQARDSGEFDGKSGVYIGTEEPSDPEINVWIIPDGEAEPEPPEIDDTAVRPDAVWSSQKVAQMLDMYVDEVDALVGGES